MAVDSFSIDDDKKARFGEYCSGRKKSKIINLLIDLVLQGSIELYEDDGELRVHGIKTIQQHEADLALRVDELEQEVVELTQQRDRLVEANNKQDRARSLTVLKAPVIDLRTEADFGEINAELTAHVKDLEKTITSISKERNRYRRDLAKALQIAQDLKERNLGMDQPSESLENPVDELEKTTAIQLFESEEDIPEVNKEPVSIELFSSEESSDLVVQDTITSTDWEISPSRRIQVDVRNGIPQIGVTGNVFLLAILEGLLQKVQLKPNELEQLEKVSALLTKELSGSPIDIQKADPAINIIKNGCDLLLART